MKVVFSSGGYKKGFHPGASTLPQIDTAIPSRAKKAPSQYDSAGESILGTVGRNIATPLAGFASGAAGALPAFASNMARLGKTAESYLDIGAENPISTFGSGLSKLAQFLGEDGSIEDGTIGDEGIKDAGVGDASHQDAGGVRNILLDLIQKKGEDWSPKSIQSSLENLTSGYLKPSSPIQESITDFSRDVGQAAGTIGSPLIGLGSVAGQRVAEAAGGGPISQTIGSLTGGAAAGGLGGLLGRGTKKTVHRVASSLGKAEEESWGKLTDVASKSTKKLEFESVLDKYLDKVAGKVKIASNGKPLKDFIDRTSEDLVKGEITPTALIDLRKSINSELLEGVYRTGKEKSSGTIRNIIKEFKNEVDDKIASSIGNLQLDAAKATTLKHQFLESDSYKIFAEKAAGSLSKKDAGSLSNLLLSIVPAGSSAAGFLIGGPKAALGALVAGTIPGAISKVLGLSSENFKILNSHPALKKEMMKAIKTLGKKTALTSAATQLNDKKAISSKNKSKMKITFTSKGKVI